MPFTPYTTNLGWRARHNEHRRIVLGAQEHAILVDVTSGKSVHRTAWNVHIWEFHAKKMPLS